MKPLKRRRTLTELAAERLRNAIIKNEYMFGEALSEKLLSESMGTSKTPIREALALLKKEGLVNIIPQSGTFVFVPSLKEVKELVELRLILESAALKCAYSRNRTLLLQSLEEALLNSKDALLVNDILEYSNLDGRFHETIFDFCDNRYLFDAFIQISGKSAALRTRISHQPNHINKTYSEHEQILTFLKNGDMEEAIQTLDRHFSSFEIYYEKYCVNMPIPNSSSTRKKTRQQNKKG